MRKTNEDHHGGKTIEWLLQDPETRHQLALKIIRASVFENNFETGSAFNSPELFKFMGYKEEEIPDTITGITKIIHPDDLPSVLDAFVANSSGLASSYYTEFRMLNKSGEWNWVEAEGQVVKRNTKGEPILLFGITKDIAERKQAEQKLREHLEMLKKAQGLTNTGSWMIDYSQNRSIWSDEFFHILGIKPEQCAPSLECYLERIHPEDRSAFLHIREKFHRSYGKNMNLQHRIIRRNDGKVRLVSQKWVSERQEDGKVLKSIGVIWDITEE